MARLAAQAPLVLSPQFKIIFVGVFGLTLLSMAASIGLSVYMLRTHGDNKAVEALIQDFSTTYKMGFAAIIGLIGGKLS